MNIGHAHSVRVAWILWDAAEPISLHSTEADAVEAREQLLHAHLTDFPNDADILSEAATIEPVDRRP